MEFVNPGFLYGLFAISIPVIIHLFNFRRFKKMYFTNVALIRELKQQTQKQSHLKHLLVLLMRILAIASLVLAFAQPYVPLSDDLISTQKTAVVSIYVDNSFSMQAESESGTLLGEAREKAKIIAGAYKSSDLFQLLTNDFSGSSQRFVSREEFLEQVDDLKISPAVKTLPEIITRQSVLFSSSPNAVKIAYEISDFQKSMMRIDFPAMDSSVRYILLPLQAVNQDNLYIDSLWYENPVHQIHQQDALSIRIRNSSNTDYEKIPVKLVINGQQKAIASVDIGKGNTSEIVLPYTNHNQGIQYCEVEITDYPITFDDKRYFTYSVEAITPVLCINGTSENIFLNSLFLKDSSFLYRNVAESNLDYSSFINYRLVILNELNSISSGLQSTLFDFVTHGGSLVVVPSADENSDQYLMLLTAFNIGSFGQPDTADTRVSELNLDHPFYADVFDDIPKNLDLPFVYGHFPLLTGSKVRIDVLLRLQNGDSFLSLFPFGKGKVFVFSVPFRPEYSLFPKHSIFVPTLYKIAISSIPNEDLYYTIGREEAISLSNMHPGNDEVFKIKDIASDFEFIPEHRSVQSSLNIFLHDQIPDAGNYTLTKENDQVRGLSFNYDKGESEMDFYTPDELKSLITENRLTALKVFDAGNQPFAKSLADFSQGIRLWKWLVILSLVFLLAESLLLRFWK